jgi:molybdopterin molybdotransferase
VMLSALLAAWPADVRDCGIVADDLDPLITMFKSLSDFDIIVTLGGASVGDHDLVRPAFEAAGAALDFWKVAIRPGKPVVAGQLDRSIILGLPGNPVSAYVTALLFLLPLVAHMSGASDPLPRRRSAVLGTGLPANGARLDHVRARFENGAVFPTAVNDSAMLSALAGSDVLVIRQPGAQPAQKGDIVEIIGLP